MSNDVSQSGRVQVAAKKKVNGEWVSIDIDDIDWENINEIRVKGKHHFVRNQWIPVTERLPEEVNCTGYGRQYSMNVLMTAHNSVDDEDIVDYGHTTDGRWFSCTADEYVPDNWSVLAWMPLPDPWKGEKDEA